MSKSGSRIKESAVGCTRLMLAFMWAFENTLRQHISLQDVKLGFGH